MPLRGSIHFHKRGQKKIPLKGLMTKGKLQRLLQFLLQVYFLSIQLIYQDKWKRCLLKFTFPFNFQITFTPNHWAKKVKTTKKWNDYVQRIAASWLSFHTISRTSSSLRILASINQQRNLSQTSSMHGILIELANNCQTELHLAMLKYPSNWMIWNLFMLDGLLRHTVISHTKMTPLSNFSMLQGSARLSYMQTMSPYE